jgi:hypothetical protein
VKKTLPRAVFPSVGLSLAEQPDDWIDVLSVQQPKTAKAMATQRPANLSSFRVFIFYLFDSGLIDWEFGCLDMRKNGFL